MFSGEMFSPSVSSTAQEAGSAVCAPSGAVVLPYTRHNKGVLKDGLKGNLKHSGGFTSYLRSGFGVGYREATYS